MRPSWLWAAAAAGAVGLTVLLAAATRGSRAREQEPARVFVVERGDLTVTVREIGTVEPLAKVEVKSKVAGRVLRFLVEEGQSVRPGQLLAQIDPTEIQSQVSQIQAQIAAAEAQLEQARTRLTLEEATSTLAIADAQQAVLASQARLEQARRQAAAQPELTRAAIAQAEANYRAAEAALAALRDSTQLQARAEARSARDQARAAVIEAEKNLERQRGLLARGFVSPSVVDAAQRAYDTAVAQREAAEERWDTLEEQQAAQRREAEAQVAQTRAALETARANAVQDALRQDEWAAARASHQQARVARERAVAAAGEVKARRAEVAAAAAGVRQLRNQLEETLVRLRDTQIVAPMGGTVTRRYVEPGELVTSGIATFSSGTPLLQIADLSRMRVMCEVNEADVGRVRRGQEVEIVLDAARRQRYRGRVAAVAPAASLEAGEERSKPGSAGEIVQFQVKIDVEGGDRHLRPGMSASVNIATDTRRGVLLLPLEAVDTTVEPARVTVLRAGKPTPVAVETGLKDETRIEIRGGVKAGERVLPAGNAGLQRRNITFSFGG